ncbi:hypothetical protein Taro_047625 [Colocasia esculenta]|uniref:Uncharacterized protein n=1 Tax=Colocasia esculenta TaxID=4460 RepID=A0A843WWK7_COLES|nr:hypothetical protein [Colocasia esculenta]
MTTSSSLQAPRACPLHERDDTTSTRAPRARRTVEESKGSLRGEEEGRRRRERARGGEWGAASVLNRRPPRRDGSAQCDNNCIATSLGVATMSRRPHPARPQKRLNLKDREKQMQWLTRSCQCCTHLTPDKAILTERTAVTSVRKGACRDPEDGAKGPRGPGLTWGFVTDRFQEIQGSTNAQFVNASAEEHTPLTC